MGNLRIKELQFEIDETGDFMFSYPVGFSIFVDIKLNFQSVEYKWKIIEDLSDRSSGFRKSGKSATIKQAIIDANNAWKKYLMNFLEEIPDNEESKK